MELANCMVALGGDTGQMVPKYHVSPSEVAVLRFIHGDDAVSEIQVVATVDRSGPADRARLHQVYGRYDGNGYMSPAVNTLFPGVAARLYERFDELPNVGIEDDDLPVQEIVTPIEEIIPLEKPKAARARKKAASAEEAPATAADETPEVDLLS